MITPEEKVQLVEKYLSESKEQQDLNYKISYSYLKGWSKEFITYVLVLGYRNNKKEHINSKELEKITSILETTYSSFTIIMDENYGFRLQIKCIRSKQ